MKTIRSSVRTQNLWRFAALAGILALLGLCVLADETRTAAERQWQWISAGGCFAVAFAFVAAIAYQLWAGFELNDSRSATGTSAKRRGSISGPSNHRSEA